MEVKDLLGIKPLGETAKAVVDKTLSGVGCFLATVCLPAFEELGMMFQDNVRTWRLRNILNVLEKAEGRLMFQDNKIQLKANPKVALSIIDNASRVEDEILQDWWAGLFASSCTEDGRDDQNLVFANLLSGLTSFEVKLLSYCCVNCKKCIFPNKLIVANDDFRLSIDEIIKITDVQDVRRIDREIDHMISIGLFASQGVFGISGFVVDEEQMIARLTPSALALNLYYKANAVNVSPELFWQDTIIPYEPGK